MTVSAPAVAAVVTGSGLLILLAYVIVLFNGLVRIRQNAEKAWVNIDVLLVQRHDEIPKLCAVVRRYAAHESGVLEALTDLRAAYVRADAVSEKAGIETELDRRLSDLRGVAEGNPDLEADRVFQKQMQRVSELEGSITDRRRFYNDTVTIHNARIRQIPQCVFAALLGYGPMPLLGESGLADGSSSVAS